MESKYKLALVGCGDISQEYLDSAPETKMVEIVKLMDVKEENMKSLSERYGIPWTTSYEEVLNDSEIYGVIICTPHYLHYPLTKKAAEAGKQVLCDKPISSNLPDAQKMIEVCREQGVSLSINYPLRFINSAKKVKEIIDSGCLGNIYFIKIEILHHKSDEYWEKGIRGRVVTDWRRSLEKSGGGILIMNASHHLDLVHYITGLKANSVIGYSGTFNTYKTPLEVEDTAVGLMQLDNGGLMQVTALSGFPARYGKVVLITGEHGVVEYRNTIRLYLNMPFENYQAGLWHTIETEKDKAMYIGYLNEWAEMQQNRSGVPVSGEDALYVLKIVKDIYRAGV